jgi:hypothetical protein
MMSKDRFMEKLLPIVTMRGWGRTFNKDRAELTFEIHKLHNFDEADLDYAIEGLKIAENIDDRSLRALMIDGKNKRIESEDYKEWRQFYKDLSVERTHRDTCTGHRQCGKCERKYCTVVAKQAQIPIGIIRHSLTMNSRDRHRYREEFDFDEHRQKMAEEFPGLGFDNKE